jgi:hypothetical protein
MSLRLRRIKLGYVGPAFAESNLVKDYVQATVLVLNFIDQASIVNIESVKDGTRRIEPRSPTSIRKALAEGRNIMCSNHNIAHVFEITTE